MREGSYSHLCPGVTRKKVMLLRFPYFLIQGFSVKLEDFDDKVGWFLKYGSYFETRAQQFPLSTNYSDGGNCLLDHRFSLGSNLCYKSIHPFIYSLD